MIVDVYKAARSADSWFCYEAWHQGTRYTSGLTALSSEEAILEDVTQRVGFAGSIELIYHDSPFPHEPRGL